MTVWEFAAMLIVALVLVLGLRHLDERLTHDERIIQALCTHGTSSAGPVTISHGKLVEKAPHPTTDSCLR